MTGNPVAEKSGRTYLLVLDLPEMMEAYERVGLQLPDVAFFKERQRRLSARLQETIPGCSLEIIEANKLVNKIASLLHDLLLVTPDAVVISTMNSVASKMSGHCLQINRLVDPAGKTLGLGARPGNNSLRSQFSDIKGCLEKRPVILVEDGSFSGGTMKSMIEICDGMHMEVKHLVIGFLFPAARENILKAFPKAKDIHCWREENFVDWMPDHDFYPFVPNAGRVVGFSYNSHHVPVYLHNGLCLCMPSFCLMESRRNGRVYRRRVPADLVSSVSRKRSPYLKRLKDSTRKGSPWRASSVPIPMSVCLSVMTKKNSRTSRRGFLIFCTTMCRCSHRHKNPKKKESFWGLFFYKNMIYFFYE